MKTPDQIHRGGEIHTMFMLMVAFSGGGGKGPGATLRVAITIQHLI